MYMYVCMYVVVGGKLECLGVSAQTVADGT